MGQDTAYWREYKRKRRLDPEFREQERSYNQAYWQKRTNKPARDARYRARYAVNNALRRGKLVRPDVCDNCRGGPRLEAHHHNGYENKLDVRWLCRICHEAEHHPI